MDKRSSSLLSTKIFLFEVKVPIKKAITLGNYNLGQNILETELDYNHQKVNVRIIRRLRHRILGNQEVSRKSLRSWI